MNKKGFTLIELLAVIVVLAIIMTVASTQVLKQKKLANEKEVESIYNSIKELGPDVYLMMDKIKADQVEEEDKVKIYSAETLKNKGYLKSTIFNPANSKKTCGACLIIDTSNADNMFDAYVECEGLTSVGYYKDKGVPGICKTDNTNETNSEEENMVDESSDEIEEIIDEDYEEATEE